MKAGVVDTVGLVLTIGESFDILAAVNGLLLVSVILMFLRTSAELTDINTALKLNARVVAA